MLIQASFIGDLVLEHGEVKEPNFRQRGQLLSSCMDDCWCSSLLCTNTATHKFFLSSEEERLCQRFLNAESMKERRARTSRREKNY